MQSTWQWLRRFRVALAAMAALLLYALVGFYLLPRIAVSKAQDYVSQTLHRQLSVSTLKLNPFTLEVTLGPLALREAGGAPLLAFQSLYVNASWASLWQRAAVLQDLHLHQPNIALVVEHDGSINLAKLVPPSDDPDSPPPAIRIGNLNIESGHLGVEDRSRPEPFMMAFTPMTFTLKDFRTDRGHDNVYRFAAATTSGEKIDWSGGFTVQPLGSIGQFSLNNLQAKTVAAYLQNQLPFQLVSGTADVAGNYTLTLNPALGLELKLPLLTLRQLAIAERGSSTTPMALDELRVQDLALSLTRRQVDISKVVLNGPHITARREANGGLNLMRLFAPTKAVDSTPKKAAEPATTAATAEPWKIAVGQLQIANGELVLEDRSVKPAALLKLAPLTASVNGFRSEAMDTALKVSADVGINGPGKLSMTGNMTLAPLSAQFDLDLQRFGLPVLQGYIAQTAALTLQAGTLDVTGKLDYRSTIKSAAAMGFSGAINVNALDTRETQSKKELLKWRQLRLSGIDFHQSPDRLNIERIDLRQPYARVAITPDRQLNISQLLVSNKTDSSPVADSNKPATKMPIRVKTIRIENGRTDFSDLSIEPAFSAGILGLSGNITGVSSAPESRAKLRLEGRVDAFSPVLIQGEANLLAATRYTDIGMSFHNMDLTTFNPYSGRFAGYNIAKGKLSTDLHYKVKDRQLEAEHHVQVDSLEFGAATDSKDAVPLPVKLAVALLKDRNGLIDLNLPVRGSLDDPTFKVGPIVWKVLINLITKAVTAPFSALGALFGSGEELGWVDFAAGSAVLTPEASGKLNTLAKALNERPQLRLDIPIATEVVQDKPALAQQALALRLPATQDDKTRLRAMELLYRELYQTGPRYPAAEADSKASENQLHIAYLQQSLLEKLSPDTAAMDQLGKDRARAVQAALLAGTGINPERLFIVSAATAANGAVEGRVRMELKLQ